MPTSGPSPKALSSVEFDQLMKPFDVSASIAVAVSGGADSLALVQLLDIGRADVCTPVPVDNLVCRLLRDNQQRPD